MYLGQIAAALVPGHRYNSLPFVPLNYLSRMTQGENIGGALYYGTTPVFVDLMRASYGFELLAGGGFVPINGSDGFPTTDFSTSHQWMPDYQPASQTYTWLVQGNPGTVGFRTANGFTNLVTTYNSGTDTATITCVSPATGVINSPVLSFTGTKRTPASAVNTGVRSIKVIRPGYESTPNQVITNEFIAACADFKELRIMDGQNINFDNLTSSWADRADGIRCRTSVSYALDNVTAVQATRGIPMEWMVDICNATGCDAWVCIPWGTSSAATNNWETGLANLWEATANAGLNLTIESGNEMWNSSFLGLPSDLNNVCIEMRGWAGQGTAGTGRNMVSVNQSAGVVTFVFGYAHGLSANENYAWNSIGSLGSWNAPVTIVNATTVTSPLAGNAGAVAINSSARGSSMDVVTTLNYGAMYDPYPAVPRWKMRRTIQASDNIRAVVGNAKMLTRYNPVWAGQMSTITDYYNATAWAVSALGVTLNTKIKALAGAPYHFGIRQSDQAYIQIGTTDTFTHVSQVGASPAAYTSQYTVADYISAYAYSSANAKADYNYELLKVIALHYGLQLWCYEGGSDTRSYSISTHTPGSMTAIELADTTNKRMAVLDPSFAATTQGLMNDAAMYGVDKFMHFIHGIKSATDYSGFGDWALTTNLSVVSSKWQGIKNFNASKPAITRNLVPGTIDARYWAGQYGDQSAAVFPSFGGRQNLYPYDGIPYMVTHKAGGNVQLTVTYKILFVVDHTYDLYVNGILIGTYTMASSVGLNNTGTIGPVAITLNAGLNSVELKHSQAQGLDGEIRSLAFV